MDSYSTLLSGTGAVLAPNDDSATSWGQGGSASGLDSYIEYIFANPGLYVIVVGRCCVSPVPAGSSYELQVSIGREEAVLLNGDRFMASVRWSTSVLSDQPGYPTEFRTDDSGIFCFFTPGC